MLYCLHFDRTTLDFVIFQKFLSYTEWMIQGLPPLWFTNIATSLVCLILQNAASFPHLPYFIFLFTYMKVEEWQKQTRFLGEEKRYNAVCRLNGVSHATHPAHAVVDFVQHLGGVISQGDGLFMHCMCTKFYSK